MCAELWLPSAAQLNPARSPRGDLLTIMGAVSSWACFWASLQSRSAKVVPRTRCCVQLRSGLAGLGAADAGEQRASSGGPPSQAG